MVVLGNNVEKRDDSLKFDFDKIMRERCHDKPGYDEFMEFLNSEENKIGDEFLGVRIKINVTQNEMAKFLKMPVTDYIKIESGASRFDMDQLKKYLNLSKSYHS